MQRWLSDLSCQGLEESKDDMNLESLVLLLKCLKIMENATFLSQDNQVSKIISCIYDNIVTCINTNDSHLVYNFIKLLIFLYNFQSHLLGMKSKPNSEHQPQSFTKLMLSIVQILSGIYFNKFFSLEVWSQCIAL